jgi:restriction system protein
MNFPNFEQILLALLIFTRDVTKETGESYNTEKAIRNLATHFGLTTEEKEILIPNNNSKVFRSLVSDARDHLRGANLIEGYNRNFGITTTGKALLRKKLVAIDEKMLHEYAGYKIFLKEQTAEAKLNAKWYKDHGFLTPQETLAASKKIVADYNNKSKKISQTSKDNGKPSELNLRYSLEEEIKKLHVEYNAKLKADILEKVTAMDPTMFEELSINVLSKLIYSDAKSSTNLKEFGKTLGRTGDGGIDGLITKQDVIHGETKYFVQCKRHKASIGAPQIRDFVGALAGQKAKFGIFVTTSYFTKAAEEFASDLEKFKIKLIDGNEFAELMIKKEVGTQRVASHYINAIDHEFFSSRIKSKTTLF